MPMSDVPHAPPSSHAKKHCCNGGTFYPIMSAAGLVHPISLDVVPHITSSPRPEREVTYNAASGGKQTHTNPNENEGVAMQWNRTTHQTKVHI